MTECIDKIKDMFGIPVEVEIHQIGGEKKEYAFKSTANLVNHYMYDSWEALQRTLVEAFADK